MSPFTIVSVVLFIGALIFVHEMGHFLVAKYFDIKITKFSLGFGPPLFAFTRGETTYQLALVPLGGYVRMVGEAPGEPVPEEDRARAFTNAPIYQRALVALAGPAANLVFPVLCFFTYNMLEPDVLPPVVGQVEAGEAADEAGLEPGDRILRAAGERTWSFQRVVEVVSDRPGEVVPLEVERDGEVVHLEVVPKPVADEDLFGKPKLKGMISVSSVPDGTRIGIDDPSRLPPGAEALRTGDTLVALNGRPLERGDRLGAAFARVAGERVRLTVERSEPLVAGGLLYAERPRLLELDVEVPDGVKRLADLGLALGASFVREVVPGGAADEAGVRPGDRVLTADGEPVQHFWRFLTELKDAEGRPVPVTLHRRGEVIATEIQPKPVECVHGVTRKPTVVYDSGFGSGPRPTDDTPCDALSRPRVSWASVLRPELEPARLSVDEALTESVELTGQVIGLLTTHLFKMLVTQEVSTDTVGGPLQFMNVAAQAAEAGILAYLQMLAFISINLGVFNLLPVPVLDGGHLLFCLVEAVKRKPLSPAAREKASLVGLALLAMLLVLALRNDIQSLGIF